MRWCKLLLNLASNNRMINCHSFLFSPIVSCWRTGVWDSKEHLHISRRRSISSNSADEALHSSILGLDHPRLHLLRHDVGAQQLLVVPQLQRTLRAHQQEIQQLQEHHHHQINIVSQSARKERFNFYFLTLSHMLPRNNKSFSFCKLAFTL